MNSRSHRKNIIRKAIESHTMKVRKKSDLISRIKHKLITNLYFLNSTRPPLICPAPSVAPYHNCLPIIDYRLIN